MSNDKKNLNNNGNVAVEVSNRKPVSRVEIVFHKEICDFKKGDVRKFDPLLALKLVTEERVAKYTNKDLQKDAIKTISNLDKMDKKREDREREEIKLETLRLKKLGYPDAEEVAVNNIKNKM